MKIIAGLGNPGSEYEETRHNIGFKVVDFLAHKHGIAVDRRKYKSFIGRGEINGIEVLLAKPQTYMNLSGRAARAIQEDLGIETNDFIIVHDDIDLALGKIKKKEKGGDAGQKGVGSIIQCLQSGEFYRIRVGVDRPQAGKDISEYVLSPFSRDEQELAQDAVELASELIEELLNP